MQPVKVLVMSHVKDKVEPQCVVAFQKGGLAKKKQTTHFCILFMANDGAWFHKNQKQFALRPVMFVDSDMVHVLPRLASAEFVNFQKR